jgi:hypothetical protein
MSDVDARMAPRDERDPEEEEYEEDHRSDAEAAPSAREAAPDEQDHLQSPPRVTTTQKKKSKRSRKGNRVDASASRVLSVQPAITQRKLPSLKKFSKLRWNGVAGRLFSTLSADNKLAWEKAYQLYYSRTPEGVQRHSFPHRFLAEAPFWSSGRLLPGLSPDGGWPIWLFHLYESMHDCIRFSFDVRLAVRDQLLPPLNEAVGSLRNAQNLASQLPDDQSSPLLAELDNAISSLVQVEGLSTSVVAGDYLHRLAHLDTDLDRSY